MNFSRRNATQPLPPSPDRIWILAWSRNFMGSSPSPAKPAKRGGWRGAKRRAGWGLRQLRASWVRSQQNVGPDQSPQRGPHPAAFGGDPPLRRGEIFHATRRERPQLLSEAQIERSSRKRSIGAELFSARMR